jgi:polar amino acid transport system ATP-binding protein
MKLEMQSIYKTMKGHEILSDLTMAIDFKILGIIGPSGGGKSTLLKVIAGLLTPETGQVLINGAKIPFTDSAALLKHRRSLGIVFQSWNLFPHLCALENIILPLHRVHGFTRAQATNEGEKLLDRFGLLSHASKRPHELSGGQSQRVAIIRAVASKPSLLLLDEPTSALDPLMTAEVLDLIVELKQEGISFILASHHMSFLQKIADQVAFIDGGKWIEAGGVHDLFQHPRQPLVQEYLSKVLKY